MNAEVRAHPKPPDFPASLHATEFFRKNDIVFLTPAVVRTSIKLYDGSTIPVGTVAIARDEMTWAEWDAAFAAKKPGENVSKDLPICFPSGSVEVETGQCTVSYRPAGGGPVAVAKVPKASLNLIRQGWPKYIAGGVDDLDTTPLSISFDCEERLFHFR